MLYENDLFITQEISRTQIIDMVISYINILATVNSKKRKFLLPLTQTTLVVNQ
jgi:hypothetical protein